MSDLGPNCFQNLLVDDTRGLSYECIFLETQRTPKTVIILSDNHLAVNLMLTSPAARALAVSFERGISIFPLYIIHSPFEIQLYSSICMQLFMNDTG